MIVIASPEKQSPLICVHGKTVSQPCEDCNELIIEIRDALSGVCWNEDRN